MSCSLPISPTYRKPIFEAVGLQALLGLLSMFILDDGAVARVCGIALIAFWAATALRIWQRPQSPTKVDLELTRFGYIPLVLLTFFSVYLIGNLHLR